MKDILEKLCRRVALRLGVYALLEAQRENLFY